VGEGAMAVRLVHEHLGGLTTRTPAAQLTGVPAPGPDR
jgi:hypothetical protein